MDKKKYEQLLMLYAEHGQIVLSMASDKLTAKQKMKMLVSFNKKLFDVLFK